MTLHPNDFFELNDPLAAELFDGCELVWQALSGLAAQVDRLVGQGQTILGDVSPGAHIGPNVYVAEGARVAPAAYVMGPAFISQGALVKHGAFVRENVIMMPGSILGHASEAKHSLLLAGACAPHFNYVGDSILGRNTNIGAGTKLSNLTLVSEKDASTGQRPTIKLVIDGQEYDTRLAKFGAVLGDKAQTGCNVVLNPGCIVGRNSLIYANTSLRKGYYPPDTVIKLRQSIEMDERR
ncbi:MAG: glucose-1-phosphate thymidylyltransferase [Chloroflexota bacterium]|nr:MAG: glucose-1-phosphate thymidylyltransferase [Chloroflexota bacterium]